jgi:tetratricopeptide (TPR) repeat protein
MQDGWLRGKRVAVTGRLVSMTHADFAELVTERGAEFVPLPNRSTNVLVIGQDGWPLESDGQQTVSLARARRYRAYGYPLELISEDIFYSRLELPEAQNAIHRRCTINQLSRLLKLSGRILRSWMRAGLFEPVEMVHRLAFFDFRQVASAKNICELTTAGVRPRQIRESLEQLRNWLPGIDYPLAQLSLLERDGRLVLRLRDEQLVEPSGQLHLDFMAEPLNDGDGSVFSAKTATAWFEEGVRFEDEGQLRDAVAAYREAISLEPNDPFLHFNLGNALRELEEADSAIEHLRQAVAYEPSYAEAWNNLGSALTDVEQYREALDAYARALRLVPTYADAHYNLARAFAVMGLKRDAARHWRAYLQFEPDSPWRDDIEQSLADCGVPSAS